MLWRGHSPEVEEDRGEGACVGHLRGLGGGGPDPQGRRTRAAQRQERHLQIGRLQARAEEIGGRVGAFLKRARW